MILNDLVTVEQARRAEGEGHGFLVRLVFKGANEANKSGQSFKYWQASYQGSVTQIGVSNYTATVSWGKIGTQGQSKRDDPTLALGRAAEKLRKGYVYDTGTGENRAQRDARLRRRAAELDRCTAEQRLARRLGGSTFHPYSRVEDVLITVADRGLIRFDPPDMDAAALIVATLRGNVTDGAIYVDRDAHLWALAVAGPHYMLARLHADGLS